MLYISTDDVKKIRVALKTEMPQYKFSVVRDHHSSVTISMMKKLPLRSLNTLTVMLVSTRKVLLVRTMGMTRLTLTTLVTSTEKRTPLSLTRLSRLQRLLVTRSGMTTVTFRLTTLTLHTMFT